MTDDIDDIDDADRCRACEEYQDCADCDGSGEDMVGSYGQEGCYDCGGSGQIVPDHCCGCGGSPYCVQCSKCRRCDGDCTCPLEVTRADGTTHVIT